MELAYDDIGAGDPALVFIHGWCCDRSYFAPQVEHFSATHRVIAVDQRGHGKSAAASDGDYAVGSLANDAADLIRALGLDRPVVIGHSLGGCVALQLAAAHPAAVRGVVMVDPAPIVLSDALRGLFATLPDLVGTVEGRKAFVGGMFAPSDDAERKARIVDGMSAMPDGIAVAALMGVGSWDGTSALAACAVPIVSIGSLAPTNEAAALKSHCGHIEIGQTVGAGHFNQLEVPEQVNAMIERFLHVSV
jgi:pimeloyl-ACP methyl ester carboxylesterase